MAIYGIIGDVHGNKEALSAVLQFLKARGIVNILSVGDIVGYNADPNDCVSMSREHGIDSIAGNHDLISIHLLTTDRCSDKAAYALMRTQSVLTSGSAEYLSKLPRMKIFEMSFMLVHGGVCDIQQYVRSRADVWENAALLKATLPNAVICFFGHSHEQRVFEIDTRSVMEVPATGPIHFLDKRFYFVNPGSVDGSRKAEPGFAECAVFDSSGRSIEFHRIPYDHATAEAKAQDQGFRMSPASARMFAIRRRVRKGIGRLLAPR